MWGFNYSLPKVNSLKYFFFKLAGKSKKAPSSLITFNYARYWSKASFFFNYFLADRKSHWFNFGPTQIRMPSAMPASATSGPFRPAILLAFVKNFISNIFYLTCSGLVLGRSKVWTYKDQNILAHPHSVVVVTTESQYIGFWIGGPLT